MKTQNTITNKHSEGKMEKEKLGSEPAFPERTYEIDAQDNYVPYDEHGMSKRFYAACAAMQGLLSPEKVFINKKELIESAYEYADELLKQENL